MALWHDQGMVTTQKKTAKKITLGHSFLQGVWLDTQEINENKSSVARNFPDRRLSVCRGGCDTTKPAKDSGRTSAANSDGLLGALLAESFIGAVFGPLLPIWAQTTDWFNVADGIDTLWLDRRTANDRTRPAQTPGISQVFVPL